MAEGRCRHIYISRSRLITADYLSGYFEADRLNSKRVSDIVYCLKQQFARHGLPTEVFSDNSPLNSREFKAFAEKYDFIHTTSSPYYPVSNGKVESSVKTCKSLLQKAIESKADPFLAFLDWRNTPSEQLHQSPAQIMFGRRTRTLFPSRNKLLSTPAQPMLKPLLQQPNRARHYITMSVHANANHLLDHRQLERNYIRIQPNGVKRKL